MGMGGAGGPVSLPIINIEAEESRGARSHLCITSQRLACSVLCAMVKGAFFKHPVGGVGARGSRGGEQAEGERSAVSRTREANGRAVAVMEHP